MSASLVGSEMCIRDRLRTVSIRPTARRPAPGSELTKVPRFDATETHRRITTYYDVLRHTTTYYD
eukprot:6950546-Alexandrium_andersonii.AAC.1